MRYLELITPHLAFNTIIDCTNNFFRLPLEHSLVLFVKI